MSDHASLESHFQRRTLTPTHEAQIRAKMVQWYWGAGALLLLAIAAIGFLIMKITDNSFAARGEWVLLVLVGLLWVWLLADTIPQLRRARLDLQVGMVATVEGIVQYEMGKTIGILSFMKYGLRVEAERFDVSQAQLFALQSGKAYRVYYTPRSRIFLEATALPDAASIPATATPSLTPLDVSPTTPRNPPATIEPINEREREILGLIAEGYANKEIAQQLSLSVNTVKMYTSQLYQKMGVKRRTEAVIRAREWGWLP